MNRGWLRLVIFRFLPQLLSERSVRLRRVTASRGSDASVDASTAAGYCLNKYLVECAGSIGERVTSALRTVVWSTGGVGSHAVDAISRRPDLELVGVWTHSPDKVG